MAHHRIKPDHFHSIGRIILWNCPSTMDLDLAGVMDVVPSQTKVKKFDQITASSLSGETGQTFVFGFDLFIVFCWRRAAEGVTSPRFLVSIKNNGCDLMNELHRLMVQRSKPKTKVCPVS